MLQHSKSLAALVLASVLLITGPCARARGEASCADLSQDLAPALDVDQVIAFAAPTARDLAHRAVDWLPAVVDGVVEGQTQDKPIVLWLYFGGPLGDC